MLKRRREEEEEGKGGSHPASGNPPCIISPLFSATLLRTVGRVSGCKGELLAEGGGVGEVGRDKRAVKERDNSDRRPAGEARRGGAFSRAPKGVNSPLCVCSRYARWRSPPAPAGYCATNTKDFSLSTHKPRHTLYPRRLNLRLWLRVTAVFKRSEARRHTVPLYKHTDADLGWALMNVKKHTVGGPDGARCRSVKMMLLGCVLTRPGVTTKPCKVVWWGGGLT